MPSSRLSFVSINILFDIAAPAIPVVLNTGATASLVDSHVIKRFNLLLTEAACPLRLNGIAGSIQITHYTDAVLYVLCTDGSLACIRQQLWMVVDFSQPAILATDFIMATDLRIDAPKHIVTFGSRELHAPISVKPRPPITLYAAHDFTLRPACAGFVPIQGRLDTVLHSSLFGAPARFVPHTHMRSTLLPAILAYDTVAVVAINSSTQPWVVRAGASLGQAVSLGEPDYCHFAGHLSPLASRLVTPCHLPVEGSAMTAIDASRDRFVVPGHHDDPLPPSARGHDDPEDPFPLAAAPYWELRPDAEAGADVVDVNSSDDITPAQTAALRKVVADHPSLWESRLGLLNTGEQMTLPTPSLDAAPASAGKPRLYCLSATDKRAVDQVFDELAASHRLVPLPYGSPVGWPVFVVWRNGKPRPVVDLRRLNALCTPDVYPLPSPEDVRDRIRGASFITCLDATKAFYQMPIADEDRWKTALLTHRGLEALRVSVMGQNRSVAFLQRVLDTHLGPHRAFCTPYVDDIFVYSSTFQDHLSHLRAVFASLQRIGLTLSPHKCHVGYRSANVLGHRTDGRLLWATDDKLAAIKSINYPATLRQLEYVVGFFSYYRNFVAGFAAIIEPLERLKTDMLAPAPRTGASRKQYVDATAVPRHSAALAALEELKRVLLLGIRLLVPDFTRPFILYVDASHKWGFALAIHQDDGTDQERPVHFESRRLTSAERNYQITELEAAGTA